MSKLRQAEEFSDIDSGCDNSSIKKRKRHEKSSYFKHVPSKNISKNLFQKLDDTLLNNSLTKFPVINDQSMPLQTTSSSENHYFNDYNQNYNTITDENNSQRDKEIHKTKKCDHAGKNL